jgi:hypothetical protein
MGTKNVSGSSQIDFTDAFNQVLNDHPPATNLPWDYRVTGWRAEAGGVIGRPVFSVDVEISGRDVD